jgi:hypothetical protein
MRKSRQLAFSAGVFYLILSTTAHANVTLTTVAYPGQAAPGTNTQFQPSPSFYPTIDDNNQISFEAIAGTQYAGNDGIWTGTAGNLSLVVYPGLVANGNAGQSYNSIIGTDVEQLGPLAYDARLNTSSGGLLFGTWIHQNNGTELQVENPNIPVPGFSSATFQSYAPDIAVNPQGQYVFFATLSSDTNGDGGIWANTNGTLQLIEHYGMQVPGFASGITWNTSVTRPEMGANGQALFFGSLSNGQTGIFSSNGTTTGSIALSGQSVPGLPGKTFGQLFNVQPHPDSDGDLAFGDGSNNLWLKNAAGYHLLASAGSAVIGGGVLSTISSIPYAANNGTVVFYGQQTNGTQGLYDSESDGIHVIARTGMQAPGQPAGTTYYDLFNPDVNNLGQTAFIADLKSPTGNVTFNYLFATEPDGAVDYVAGAGTSVSLPNGTFTATSGADLYARDFSDVEATQFNDNGDLVFTLMQYAGQQPAVIMEAQIVPEPTSLTLLIAASTILIHRRSFRSRDCRGMNSGARE